MFLLKYALAAFIDDVPFEVDLQLHRQEFIIGKVIDGKPDETDEEFQAADLKSNVIVGDTDYDWQTDDGYSDEEEEDEEEDEGKEGEGDEEKHGESKGGDNV
jgi:hypothetical protein